VYLYSAINKSLIALRKQH